MLSCSDSTRSTRLGARYDLDSVSATYADGRLTITVRTAPAAQPRKIAVSTAAAVAAVETGPTVEAGGAATDVPAGEVIKG